MGTVKLGSEPTANGTPLPRTGNVEDVRLYGGTMRNIRNDETRDVARVR